MTDTIHQGYMRTLIIYENRKLRVLTLYLENAQF